MMASTKTMMASTTNAMTISGKRAFIFYAFRVRDRLAAWTANRRVELRFPP